MTPLKPIENLRVAGVMAVRYPLNRKCAHPECTEEVNGGPHHCFPRSQIGNDFWFVEIEEWGETQILHPIPHVSGLCLAHHNAVEAHDAWIKLEDYEFVWYDRYEREVPTTHETYEGPDWQKVGPLNPQPGSREGKPKRKKFKGEARRQRKTISIKVPADKQEDGGEVWDVLLEAVYERLESAGMKDVREKGVYIALVAVIHDWLTS